MTQGEDEEEDHEPTEEAMVNACQTALATVKEAWQSLQGQCSGAGALEDMVEYVTDSVGQRLILHKGTIENQKPTKKATPLLSLPGEKEELEDEFFLQWTKTIEKQGLRQLRTTLQNDADDPEAEEPLREAGRCLFCVLLALHAVCELHRNVLIVNPQCI